MSAYICDDIHLSVLAAYAVQNHVAEPSPDFKRDYTPAMVLAERMHAANARSIQARYGDDPDMLPPFEWTPRAEFLARSLSAVQIIKAAHCYAYQASEADGWETSEAKQVVDGIVSAATHKLPGYAEAAWGIAV